MRFRELVPTVLMTSALMSSLGAQEPPIFRVGPRPIGMPGARSFVMLAGDAPRAVIGVSTTSAATTRDTLGVLVMAVRAGSPAEKAGIEEGNRISAINGRSLRLSAADVGDDQVAGLMPRRLTRELDKLTPGADVELRVSANGEMKTVKIKTVSPADLYESRSARRRGDRATLGVGLAVTGSQRDSLGVFVLSVEDGGAAAKAGIEEGSRVASINGVDVRSRRARDEDGFAIEASNVSRLEREVSRLKPGDDVDLRIYFNGQVRNVKLKAGRVSDLPRRNRAMTMVKQDNFVVPDVRAQLDGPRLDAEMRHALEWGRAGMGRAFARIGGQVDW